MRKRVFNCLVVGVLTTSLIVMAGCGKTEQPEYTGIIYDMDGNPVNVQEDSLYKPDEPAEGDIYYTFPDTSKMNKKQLQEAYAELVTQYSTVQNEYNELNETYQKLVGKDEPTSSIYVTGDGTGRYSFHSIDSQIVFPEQFQYPNSEQIAGIGAVEPANNLFITPGGNWICKLNGSSVELEHSSGISGTIKISKAITTYDVDRIQQEVLAPWFTSIPQNSVNYTDIFVNGYPWGKQATLSYLIEGEDAFIRCGMVGFSEYAMIYVFTYRGSQDATKDESILNLLNSTTIAGQKLEVQ